jgi:hypothetical protein
MQPKYAKLARKFAARQENLKFVMELAGLKKLPADRQYWTLANEQPDEDGSEINQLVDMGFLSKSQFYGVDNKKAIIDANKLAHATAHWFYGSWIDIISEYPDFNPGVIYLDAIHHADSEASIQLLSRTMRYTPPGTVLLFNVQSRSAYAKNLVINCSALTERLPYCVPFSELRHWRTDIPSFTYTSSRAEMRTFAFYREN